MLRLMRIKRAASGLVAAQRYAARRCPQWHMNHSVAFPGLQAPAAGFDEPFAMLGACHERVRRSLALLQRLVEHAAAHGADAQARDAARDCCATSRRPRRDTTRTRSVT
jgi:hypothetical protein